MTPMLVTMVILGILLGLLMVHGESPEIRQEKARRVRAKQKAEK